MNPTDTKRATEFSKRLAKASCVGVSDEQTSLVFIHQLVESVRRAEYYPVIAARRPPSALRGNPDEPCFEPILAAMVRLREGQYDDAAWLVFLAVHFGRNSRTGWSLARATYRRWNWAKISSNVSDFRDWLKRGHLLKSGSFGNHRKYQSLSGVSDVGTGVAVESYVRWIGVTHRDALASFPVESPRATFDRLYASMDGVRSFGRTARFDYLTTLAKIGMTAAEPGRLYLVGATGPLAGARLMFGHGMPSALDKLCVDLADSLGVPPHVLEDALCNWQKSPQNFVRFRG